MVRGLRIVTEAGAESFGSVKVADPTRNSFRGSRVEMPDDSSIACVEERYAQSVPFADGSEHACRITFCLLKDVLWIYGHFLRLDYTKQLATHKKGIVSWPVRCRQFLHRGLIQCREIERVGKRHDIPPQLFQPSVDSLFPRLPLALV